MADDCVELGFEEHVVEIQAEDNRAGRRQKQKFQKHEFSYSNLLLLNCVSCSQPHNNKRHFNLQNRKCLQENLFEKLTLALGDVNLVRSLYKCKDAYICRICLNKLIIACSFLKKLKHGIKAYIASYENLDDFDKDRSDFTFSEDTGPARTSQYDDSDSTESDGLSNEGADEKPFPYPDRIPTSVSGERFLDHTGRSSLRGTVDSPLEYLDSGKRPTLAIGERPLDHGYCQGERIRKFQSDEGADVEMMEGDTEAESGFLHSVPTEHSYSRSVPQRPVIEIDSESTDSASESEMTNLPNMANFNKRCMQNQRLKNDRTAVKPVADVDATVKPVADDEATVKSVADVVQSVNKPEPGKSEVKLIISPDDSNTGTYKICIGGISFTRKVADVSNVTSQEEPVAPNSSPAVTDNEKLKKKPIFKTPYRHLESVLRFGEVRDVNKGSQVVDLTKQTEASDLNWTPLDSDKDLTFPLNWDCWLPQLQDFKTNEERKFYVALDRAVLYRNMTDLMSTLLGHREIKQKMRQAYVEYVKTECQSLCTPKHFKNLENCTSVLMKFNSLSRLNDIKDYVAEIFAEIKSRCPYLLDILVGVTGAAPTSLPVEHIGPITSAYAVLMKARCMSMSGWHKMVHCLLDHGYVESRMLVVLNHMGILSGSVGKYKLLESIALDRQRELAQRLKDYPLAKVTLDIKTRPSGQLETENNEMQVLVSSLILAKDVDQSLDSTEPPFPDKIPSTTFVPSAESLNQLQSVYAVLIGRIIKDLPGLSWLRLPEHIPHSRSEWSTQQTEIHPLITAFCYETRRNDGVKVLQTLQDSLNQLYTKCAEEGGDSKRPTVPIGGDQLSRAQLECVRLKKKRKVSQKERFNHLGPNVTEFWHNKKDFVVKAYKALYNKKSFNEPGTLYYFKSKMQLAFVTENFDKNFDAHHDLLVHLGRSLIQEQAIEYFGLDPETGGNTKNIPENINLKTEGEKQRETEMVLKEFLKHYGYATMVFQDFKPGERYEMVTVPETGQQLLVKLPEKVEEKEDEVYNYCMQLTHWTLHLLEMEDTAREGDGDRLVINSQYCLPFFYSFSPFSNQLTENVDFLIKVKHTLSPQMKELVLRTAFVNLEGGEGKCCEADLAHEKVTRNQKSLVRHLDGLATDRMVKGVAASADIVCHIADNAAHSLRILKGKTKASQKLSDKQVELIRTTLRNLRPFNKEPGRECVGFKGIHAFPFQKVSRSNMFQRLDRIVGRMRKDVGLEGNDEEETVMSVSVPEPEVKRKRVKKLQTTVPNTNLKTTPASNSSASPTVNSTAMSSTISIATPKTNSVAVSKNNFSTTPKTISIAMPTTNFTATTKTNSIATSTTSFTATPETNSIATPTTNSTPTSRITSTMPGAKNVATQLVIPSGGVQVIPINVPIDPDILRLLKA